MTIDLLFITFNRLDYTKIALASVLADPEEEFNLTIWDNASSDETAHYLKTEVRDRRIKNIVLSPQNVGQTAAINEIWTSSTADLVGKLDNDCVVTPGWTRTLAAAHRDIDQLGVVACWHFFADDFDYARAQHKIHQFGAHRIVRHPWTCGTGLLVKTKTVKRFGAFRGKATTDYWMKMANSGMVNGFYYPLVLQENMDDPRSQYSRLRRMSFEDAYKHSHGFRTGTVSSEENTRALQDKILDNLLTGPWDPKHYRVPPLTRMWRRAGGVVRQATRLFR